MLHLGPGKYFGSQRALGIRLVLERANAQKSEVTIHCDLPTKFA